MTRKFDDGPDSLGCAVAFVLLMFGGVLLLIALTIFWGKATSGR